MENHLSVPAPYARIGGFTGATVIGVLRRGTLQMNPE
jgi:K+/H+ antiporter YhaU regulatory subunit KhtT